MRCASPGFPSCSPRNAWSRPCSIASAAGLLEFTNRQIIITRVYEPRLWALGGFAHALYCGAVLAGVGLFFSNTIAGSPAVHLLLLALAPPVLSMGRGVLRLTAIMDLLPDWKTKLLADGWIWTLPCGPRAVPGSVELPSGLVQQENPLARRPLPASLAGPNPHPHSLTERKGHRVLDFIRVLRVDLFLQGERRYTARPSRNQSQLQRLKPIFLRIFADGLKPVPPWEFKILRATRRIPRIGGTEDIEKNEDTETLAKA